MNYNMQSVNAIWPINSLENIPVSQHNMTVNQPVMPMVASIDIFTTTSSNSFPSKGISGENIYGAIEMGNSNQSRGVASEKKVFVPVINEIVHLKKCVLYPPDPNALLPTRKRPLGCKTVFIGGLPEKITEEIVKDIFERCGIIETIKMSKKFCHIRFTNEISAQNAIFYSGCRLKIENKDDTRFSSRLHVSYASAHDDQHDYKSQQRQARRQNMDYYRHPEICYSDSEASSICEELKKEETFTKASSVLIMWLEKGECKKNTASSFFSMIQSTYSHAKELQLEKVKYEDELNKAKTMLKNKFEGIIQRLTEIENIYNIASSQKNWNQFNKIQRKNIEMWKKQSEELKNAILEEVINERDEKEMEFSDDEKDAKTDNEELSHYQQEIPKLQEEYDSLRCQLDAAENEFIAMQTDHQTLLNCKDSQITAMQQGLQQLKEKELTRNEKLSGDENELKEFCEYKHKVAKGNCDGNNDLICENKTSANTDLEKEAYLISLISIFLLDFPAIDSQPFGANIDYICSFLQQIDPTIKSSDVENILKRYPMTFTEDPTGIGANLKKKWHFTVQKSN